MAADSGSTGRVRVVLVAPSHPGNIGAAARAMKTMGLSRLCLVRPEAFPHGDATARAAGADDVLAGAEVHGRLIDAVADCGLVLGSSARLRGGRWRTLEPRAAAAEAAAAAARAPVAMVFGRERTGLTNDEMDLCHALVHIPASPDYSSLNLASAVQILAYELHLALRETADREPRRVAAEDRPATAAELAHLYEHMEEVLRGIGFLENANPRHLMRRLRRLFNRAGPEWREVQILRGVLSAVQGERSRRADRTDGCEARRKR